MQPDRRSIVIFFGASLALHAAALALLAALGPLSTPDLRVAVGDAGAPSLHLISIEVSEEPAPSPTPRPTDTEPQAATPTTITTAAVPVVETPEWEFDGVLSSLSVIASRTNSAAQRRTDAAERRLTGALDAGRSRLSQALTAAESWLARSSEAVTSADLSVTRPPITPAPQPRPVALDSPAIDTVTSEEITSSPSLAGAAADSGVDSHPRPWPGNPAPKYPREALKRRWHGRVVLRLTVEPSGSVSGIEVAESSGYAALDGAASDAARAWRFEPALDAGTPIRCEITAPVDFLLKRGTDE